MNAKAKKIKEQVKRIGKHRLQLVDCPARNIIQLRSVTMNGKFWQKTICFHSTPLYLSIRTNNYLRKHKIDIFLRKRYGPLMFRMDSKKNFNVLAVQRATVLILLKVCA